MNDREAVPRAADLASLVRAPAALSVPGDVLVGATAAGRPLGLRTAGVMASSVCLYWAGMALSDYADAAVDSVERPERPIPSGRVPRRTARSVAAGLTAAGLGLAGLSGGRRGLAAALPLTALVWAYDLKLKSTPAGPAAMAGARVLDVLAGAVAGGGKPPSPAPGGTVGTASGETARALGRAALPALLTGLHTCTLTLLSRHEISNAPARLPAATLAVSSATAVAGAWPLGRPTRPTPRASAAGTAVAAAAALAYLGTYGRAQALAVRDPSGGAVRRAVGAGILAMVPLRAALTARGGAPGAAVLGAVHPLALRPAGRVSPT
ncbi:SCO3242 family prenyltransferase [Streptomyces sp. AC555_RSS877]|uniref:SCO3242 family prenyltransferase n=1 Tax=Streptomyces sp. AC555_RSS877 TaxID=2823688 RepID=UPI001C25938E|nr:UbiA family prenyltransferase [Streptomyces sp. AC555_RSS877]